MENTITNTFLEGFGIGALIALLLVVVYLVGRQDPEKGVCRYCRRQLHPRWKFCPDCGTMSH